MSSLLIYGVIAADAAAALDLDGLAEGIRVITGDTVAAIVGTPPPGADPQPPARADTARWLTQHQRVLEAAITETAVLPMKFATVAADEPAARRVLIQGQKLLAAQLQQFASRLQMDIVVEWVLNEVFIEIAGEPGIADLRAAVIDGDDPDARFQLGLAVKAALDVRRTALAAEICEALRPAALEVALNPLPDERTVASIALLMERDGLDVLDAVLDRLDADHDGRLKFRCAGPRAPSAFVTIEVHFPAREDVERAWHTLQLGSRANATEIKSSYFRIARELQPEAARGEGPGLSAGMAELAQAHRLLTACAKTSGEELQLYGPALLSIAITHPGQQVAAPTPEAGQEAAA